MMKYLSVISIWLPSTVKDTLFLCAKRTEFVMSKEDVIVVSWPTADDNQKTWNHYERLTPRVVQTTGFVKLVKMIKRLSLPLIAQLQIDDEKALFLLLNKLIARQLKRSLTSYP